MRPNLFDDGVEGCRVGDGEFAEHLAIQRNPGVVQGGNEAAVADAALFDGRAEALDPEGAEMSLLLTAVAVGVDAGLADEFLCGAVDRTRAADETFRAFKKTFTA